MTMNLTTEAMEMINKAAAEKGVKGTDIVWAIVNAMTAAEDKIYAERKEGFECNARICRHISNMLIYSSIRKGAITDDMPIISAIEKAFEIVLNCIPYDWRPMMSSIVNINELIARVKGKETACV